MKFYKYHGTGNDFVLIDNREGILTGNENELFAEMCRRHFGIGADGVILLNSDPEVDFYMDYFNSDGNRSTMCGNGGRCLAAFAKKLGMVSEKTTFRAIDGLHEAVFTDKGVKLKMTMPEGMCQSGDWDFWVDTGSPHHVRMQNSEAKYVSLVNVAKKGAKIRNKEEYQPDGTNVNFMSIIGPQRLVARTYERGVEAETLSCGTGVVACAEVFGLFSGYTEEPIHVETRGGILWVHREEGKAPWLEGPAEFVFSGEWLTN